MGIMKSKLSQIIFSLITGASLAGTGRGEVANPSSSVHQIMVDKEPKATLSKLTPIQIKEVLDLKLKGVDAYILTIENSSRRTYSVSTSSFDQTIISYQDAQKILEKKGNMGISAGLSVAGLGFAPLGVIGNIYSFTQLKKGKIFEGKLQAMLLNQDVVNSYGILARIILVKNDRELSKIELIDMQTSAPKSLYLS